MSLLSSFKKALGFPDEYDEESDATESDGQVYSDNIPLAANTTEPNANASAPAVETDSLEVRLTDAAIPGEVLDAVIEQFNATQPDFVKNCLSIEAQRSYILERMDVDLREKLRAEAEEARRVGLRQCEAERARMASDIQRMKADKNKMTRQKEEFENAQLSATRQKRALKERVSDLEQQVEQLEAEREQLQLENRTLVNKLRVADVKTNFADGSDAEIDRIASENIALTDRVHQLESDLEEARKAADQPTDDHIPQEFMDEIEGRLAEFEELKQRKDKRIASLEKELLEEKTTKDELSTEFQKQLTDLESDLLKTRTESEDQARRFHSEIDEKERQISDLQVEVKRLTQLINAVDSPTPQNKKKRQRNNDSDRGHISAVEKPAAEIVEPDTRTADPAPKISAIDELMDSTDWFTSPDPIPPKKDPEVEELFGYKEPQKKPSADNERQLSLF